MTIRDLERESESERERGRQVCMYTRVTGSAPLSLYCIFLWASEMAERDT